jgi:ribosome-associated translation inhibitor RaiA
MISYHVEVTLRGQVPKRAKDYATAKIGALVRYAPLPILGARVKLTHLRHRSTGEQVMAEVNLDVNGRPVRAQVAADSSHEAIDLAQDRLRRKLSQLGRHPARESGRQRSHRPRFAARPPVEREIRRRKAFEPATASVDEAVFDLELMDYDFQLFHDVESDMDSVIYRDTPNGYRLTRLGITDAVPSAAVPVTVDCSPAPVMPIVAAVGTLDAGDTSFVFFADSATGRGNVLYRRHDGHYGLITPA